VGVPAEEFKKNLRCGLAGKKEKWHAFCDCDRNERRRKIAGIKDI
jgi:hypothetical protein